MPSSERKKLEALFRAPGQQALLKRRHESGAAEDPRLFPAGRDEQNLFFSRNVHLS